MVSHNVSQSSSKTSLENLFDTPGRVSTNRQILENLKGTGSQQASECPPRGSLTSSQHDINAGIAPNFERDAQKNLIVTTQSVSGTVSSADPFFRTDSPPDEASTAPTLNSLREVSGMPSAGNGCIFKHTNKSGKVVWKIEVTVGRDFKGNRKRVRRTAKSHSDAIKIHRAMLAELEEGTLGRTSSSTFEAYAEWWLNNVSALSVRASTLSDYQSRLKLNAYPSFGHRRITELTSRDLQEWLVALVKQGKSTNTINGARQVVSAVLGYAHENGDIPRNPAKLVRKIPKRQGERTLVQSPWTAEEARNVLRMAQDTSMDLFIHLGLLFGLRRGEILGLQWGDFNFEEGWVSVQRTLKEQSTRGPDGKNRIELVTNDTKTTTSIRRLYLPPALLSSIQRHREYVGQLQRSAGAKWVDSPYVFVSSMGTPVFPTNMTKAFARFLKGKNLRHIRVHDMRHTAAVLSLSAGVRIESVSQGLGHSRIDTTKGVYAPIVQSLNDEFTRGLANWLVPETQLATFIIDNERNRHDQEIRTSSGTTLG